LNTAFISSILQLGRGSRVLTGPGAAGEGAFAAVLRKVDTLDFGTPASKAVFYSGPGQGVRATLFAGRINGMTIEMTAGGRTLAADPLFQSLSPAEQFLVWQRASTPFAEGAAGAVNAFIRGSRPDRTFRAIEEPIVTVNPSVYRYIYHY